MKKKKTGLLLIFTRNPELGKCKTRLAAKVGDKSALDIYVFLLQHTFSITANLDVDKCVYYSEEIRKNDIWSRGNFIKKLQNGGDLGARMYNAFNDAVKDGYEKIIIIGSDMYDLSKNDIEHAFELLNTHDFVLGPALDGGYYLLGMKTLKKQVFEEKDWGKSSVFNDTLASLEGEDYALLETRNDVDYYEDIKDVEAFRPFLKHIKND